MKPRKGETDQQLLDRVMRGLLKHFSNMVMVSMDENGEIIVLAGGDGNESQQRFIRTATRVLQTWAAETAGKADEHEERMMQIIHAMVAHGPQRERN
jgi:L-asparaginase II